jgi:phosphopantothenoylcysteine decarboxylase/phosphopantothenate--cysteine ligase
VCDGSGAATGLHLPREIVVMAAAVADYRPAKVSDQKVKKADGELSIELERTDDILAYLGQRRAAWQHGATGLHGAAGQHGTVDLHGAQGHHGVAGHHGAAGQDGAKGQHPMPGQFLCGFSMETENVLENSRKKLEKKHIDMIVANDLNVAGAGFGTDTNVVTLITADGERTLPIMDKEDVAAAIFDEITRSAK